MARARIEDIIIDIFEQGVPTYGGNHKWHYLIRYSEGSTPATEQQKKEIMDKVYNAFFGAIGKRKLAEIHPLVKSGDNYYGISPGDIWSYGAQHQQLVVPIGIEPDGNRVNLVNLETGEIRQNILKDKE